LRLKLFPANDNFVLVCPQGGNQNYQFVIIDIRLCIFTLEVSNSLILVHHQILQKCNARYPFKRIALKHITIPQGVQSALSDNIYHGVLPSIVISVFVSDASMAGGYQQNPFEFNHFNLNHLCLYVNGEQVPSKPFQPNFANNLYLREYKSLYESLGIKSIDQSLSISRTSYAQGYTLFAFNLKPDPFADLAVTATRNGSIRVEIKFSQATAHTINLILFSEFESLIEIDKYLNVIGPV